jgi:hypothetical protein
MDTPLPLPTPEPHPNDLHPSVRPVEHVRWIVPHECLAPDVRQRLAAQDAILAGLVLLMAEAVGQPIPESFEQPRTVPPGWWWAPDTLGHCTPRGLVSLVACGAQGADLYAADQDHRLRGLAPQACAIVALHEIAHAILHLRVGPERTASMLAAAKGEDAAMEGWADLCGQLSRALFGHDLPPDYRFARWPSRAPGSLRLVDQVASALAAHALPPVDEAVARRNLAAADADFCSRYNFDRALRRALVRLGVEVPA